MEMTALAISIVVAIAVIYREFIHHRLFRPNLRIEFGLEEPISRETTVELPPPPGMVESIRLKAFWVRLRIVNDGNTTAQRCEGILDEVANPDGTTNKRYDPLTLRWAIAPIERGLEPLDIASHRCVDLNVFTTFEHETFVQFATHPDPRGVPLSLQPGGYWLRIAIYGDNFKPIKRGYAVHWNGENYREVDMKPMNDRPSSTTAWPWP